MGVLNKVASECISLSQVFDNHIQPTIYIFNIRSFYSLILVSASAQNIPYQADPKYIRLDFFLQFNYMSLSL